MLTGRLGRLPDTGSGSRRPLGSRLRIADRTRAAPSSGPFTIEVRGARHPNRDEITGKERLARQPGERDGESRLALSRNRYSPGQKFVWIFSVFFFWPPSGVWKRH